MSDAPNYCLHACMKYSRGNYFVFSKTAVIQLLYYARNVISTPIGYMHNTILAVIKIARSIIESFKPIIRLPSFFENKKKNMPLLSEFYYQPFCLVLQEKNQNKQSTEGTDFQLR